jgi:DNA-binding MarR family transcriptional regulator
MSDELDPMIHATSRLKIMTTLYKLGGDDALAFPRLANLLGMTHGNLSVHLSKLEQVDYVHIEKTFEGKKPVTFVSITATGRKAFDAYLHALQDLLQGD